jgi:hypothetical protein
MSRQHWLAATAADTPPPEKAGQHGRGDLGSRDHHAHVTMQDCDPL